MQSNNIYSNLNHPKLALRQLREREDLPFRDILSSKCISKSLEAMEYRDRIFTPDLVIWAFLSQVISDDKSCQSAVARLVAFFVSQEKKPPSANTAAYCKARARLSEQMISSLAKASAREIEENAPPDWLWRKRTIRLIDGSTLFMPDTEKNQHVYPQMKNQKPGLGFPIARIVAAISYATGVVLDMAVGCCFGEGAGEHALLRQILPVFKAGDIAMGDCYYGSFFLIATLMAAGVDVVFPINAARHYDFRQGIRLGKKDHLVQWKKPMKLKWMTQEDYLTFADSLSIREVEIQKECKGFKAQKRIILTTLMEPTHVSKKDLSELYDYRWCVEVDLKTIKDTMRMGILRGKTPEMLRKEIWMHLPAYNLLRKVMAQATYLHNRQPRTLSFKLTLQMVNAFKQQSVFSENKKNVYLCLLNAIAYKTVANRPHRHEPRRLKRRPKNYPLLLKPRHRYHEKML